MGFVEKLKQKWQLKNSWQVFVILLVFACTGFSALFAKNAFYYVMDIDPETLSREAKIGITLFSLIFLYPIFLLSYGFLFGQFDFFWNFKKRMFKRIGQSFSKKQASE